MVGSLSHLLTSGISTYTEELVKVVRNISNSSGATVIPSIMLPMGGGGEGGVDDQLGVSQLFNLDSWILSGKMAKLQVSMKTSCFHENFKFP